MVAPIQVPSQSDSSIDGPEQNIWSAEPHGTLLSYGSALVTCALALAASLLLDPQSQGKPLPEFLVAVAVAAWYGGFGAGILAAIFGALALAFFFDQPYGSLEVAKPAAIVDLVLMLAAAVLITWLTGSLRVARQRAAAGWAEAQAAARRASVLAEVSRVLSTSAADAASLKRVVDVVVPHLADWCRMDVLATEVTAGVAPLHSAQDTPRRGQTQLASTASDKTLHLPLVGQDGQLGQLHFGLLDGRRWAAGDRALADEIARRAALAIDNAQLHVAEQHARVDAEGLAAERAAVLAHIADGVVVTNADGQIRFMNEAARVLLAKCGGQTAALELSRLALASGVVLDREICIDTPNGEVIALCTAVPLQTAQGASSGAVVTLRDVTAAHGLARQKEEFLANASHDLRTPVATIKASIDVVRDNLPADFPELLAGLLDNIDREADRMGSFVDDLLELTRLEVGNIQLHPVPCDLAVVVCRAAQAIEPLAACRRQAVRVQLPEHGVPGVVDPLRVERALMNLLSNAQKYGRDGGFIEVRLEEHSSSVVLAVRDDGPGVAPADQPHIFERFFRATSEATRRAQGSGLGLPIARAMIELHEGTLTVESVPGEGATFRIELPTGH